MSISFLLLIGVLLMKKIIELKNISKSYDGNKVLDNISLDIYDNEFFEMAT